MDYAENDDSDYDDDDNRMHRMPTVKKAQVSTLSRNLKYKLITLGIAMDTLDDFLFSKRDENQMISIR